MKKLLFAASAFLLTIGLCGCGKLFAGKNEIPGAFEYRDIYLPEYSKDSNDELGLNTVDEDWGIWGHNLGNVLPESPSYQVYATVNGNTEEEQFCFSSNKLYEYIVDYIDNNYALTDSISFAILPNDNGIVCLCEECVKAGNKAGNAAPAVFNMINRLAKKYPEHKFYTSHYATTKDLPKNKMPHNTGVIVSAMDYPLSAKGTPQETAFIELLNNWKQKTDKIVIWDYVNNFDDYFTPYPVFTVMHRRFKNYKNAGVTGIFLNGSGPDYSAFADIKKAVLAELMVNPDLNWETLVKKTAKEYYPVAGDEIASFMIEQEKMVESNGKKLPLYEGVNVAVKTYLPEEKFVNFYNKLVDLTDEASGSESERLETLVNTLSFTMLELKRINGDLSDTEILKERVRALRNDDIESYNEGAWNIEQYLSNYDFMEKNARETASTNKLKGVKLIPRTKLDEDYPDISIVTDGLLGIPSNYHNGNLITSADPSFSLTIPRQPGMKTLKVWMVHNPGFKIGLPSEVSVSVGGVRRGSKVPERPMGGVGHSVLEFDIPGDGDITLTLTKSPEVKTMAIDEIEGF